MPSRDVRGSALLTVLDVVPSAVTFQTDFEAPGLPLLVRGGVATWSAIGKWSVETLVQFVGDEEFELEYSSSGLFDPNIRDPAFKVSTQTMNYGLALPYLTSSDAGAYYIREADLSCVGTSLLRDIESIPLIQNVSRTYPPRLWVGSKGASSPIHFDGGDYNFLAHVSGAKMFRLYAPRETRKLYPALRERLPHLSQVSHLTPDLRRFPKYAEAAYCEFDLYPGDLLFVPRGWWHCTTSKTPTISVNFFWQRTWLSRCHLSGSTAIRRLLGPA